MARPPYSLLACCLMVAASASGASCGKQTRDFVHAAAGEGGEAGQRQSSAHAGRGALDAAGASGESGAGGEGGAAGAGAPSSNGATGCAAIVRPANVAAKDFQCLDFDDGTLGSFASAATGGGNVESVTDVAFSPPRSVKMAVPNAKSAANLTWTAVGSTQITSVSVKAKINPQALPSLMNAWNTPTSLLCVHLGMSTDCLDFDGKVLTLEVDYEGDAAMIARCTVSGNLASGLWNDVELRVTPAKVAELLIGGALKSDSCSAMHDADTSVTATVGLIAAANTSAWNVNYDDVVVTVTR